MKSTYNITIVHNDSYDRFNVYKHSTIEDLVDLLNYIARLDKAEWNVEISKGREIPYGVDIFICCTRNDKTWAHYTITIEDGEADV